MNFKRLYRKACCVMQWNIGLANGDIREIIKSKKNHLSFKWLPIKERNRSVADPFIFKGENSNILMLFEEFSMTDLKSYGRIFLSELDENFEVISTKKILDKGSHLSYPSVIKENEKVFVMPESKHQGKVNCYNFDFESNQLRDEQTVIRNLPLLDSTILKHNDKYWLFATMGDGVGDCSKLYIYFSDSLFGSYIPHKKNPVKSGLNGTRPAGSFIEFEGEIYRPTQNCKNYYGESLTINKVIQLDENSFEEIVHFELTGDKNSKYCAGIHTLNVSGNVIVVDGIRMTFDPIKKILLFFQKSIRGRRDSLKN